MIEKILKRYGYVPETEVRRAEVNLNEQWKNIIVTPKLLAYEQTVVRMERDLKKRMEKSILAGVKRENIRKFIVKKEKQS